MPGSTPVLAFPYAVGADAPPSIEDATRPLAERIETVLTPSGLAAGDGLKWNGTAWVREAFATALAHADHVADTTDVHGITDTSQLAYLSDLEDLMNTTVYLESDAPAGSTTGQTAPGTSYQDLQNTDTGAVEETIPEDGAYLVEVQGGGSVGGTGKQPAGRVYRTGDNKTLLERGWGPTDASASYGTGAANMQAWVSDHVDVGAGDPRRVVQLSAGDVVRVQYKVNSGTLTLNRDLCHVILTKVAATGGGAPS